MERKVDEKKGRLLDALEKGVTQVHLDARRPGVLVPPQLKEDHHLILNVSYRFDPPDLAVNEWGVRQTLSFGGKRFTVGLPWSAIYAVASLTTREFYMFPDDMPDELLAGLTETQEAVLAPSPAPSAPEAPKTAQAILREVATPPAAAEPGSGGEGPTEPTPPKRGHLRLVK